MADHYVDSVGQTVNISLPEAPKTDPENGEPLQTDAERAPLMFSQGDQYIEKLLSKIRSDAVYELRKLQHQHRPVSGFDSKPALENLLERRRQASRPAETSATPAADEDLHPSSEFDRRVQHFLSISTSSGVGDSGTQEHMPPSIRLEIRGLIERQQVSGLLNSARAGEIERTLNEGLERRNRQMQRRAVRHPSQQRHREETRGGIPGRAPHHGPSANNLGPTDALPQRQPENGQYRVPRRDQSLIVRQLQESPALGSLDPAERERIVSEVNQLVEQHLVTSALSGEFRGVLELHIQNRADQVRNDVTAEDIGRSLQRRTDYTASTARAFDPEVPSSAAMSEMRQELRDMRSQILELKQLTRTSFDLQLEIQRAIRQEVAAALSSVCGPLSSLSSQPTGLLSNTAVVESGICVICSEASISSVVYRCGHMCVCMQCGLELKAQGLKCPICRAPITDIIRAYSSMQ
jgi:hypothetical protein